MYCGNCGKQIADNAKFCNYCGGRIVGETVKNNGEIKNSKRKGKYLIVLLSALFVGGGVYIVLSKNMVEWTSKAGDIQIDANNDEVVRQFEDITDADIMQVEEKDNSESAVADDLMEEFENKAREEETDGDEENLMSVSSINPDDYYDYVLCSGGGYSIVAKQEESVTDVIEYVGVLDDEFNWVIPLSEKTYINPYDNKVMGKWTGYSDFEDRCQSVSDMLTYAGGDMFVYGQNYKWAMYSEDSYNSVWIGINADEEWPGEDGNPKIFHVLSNEWVDIHPDYLSHDSIYFTDGYYVAANADSYSDWGGGKYVLIINCETGAQETSVYCENCKYIGRYSEEVFFSYDGFYNINCEKVIDLSKYAGTIINRPYFENGKCELIAENENGTKYIAIIDKQGNFVSQFSETE